nr:unnamed protein product [Digitaria exilis]
MAGDVATSPAPPPPSASSSSHHHHHHAPTTVRGLLCHAVAGASAGVVAATFVCPLDVIKTRFQVHGWPKLATGSMGGSVIIGSLQQIAQREGLRGMYRGLSPTVLALLPNWAVYFTVYEQLKSLLSDNDGSHQLSLGANVVAASCAGAATSIVTNPLWVVKTRFQASSKRDERIPTEAIQIGSNGHVSCRLTQKLSRRRTQMLALLPSCTGGHAAGGGRLQLQTPSRYGRVPWAAGAACPATYLSQRELELEVPSCPSVCYCRCVVGLVPALAGVSHVAIQFPAYEKIKAYLAARNNTTVEALSVGDVAVASSLAKVAASTMTYPHEVVRSRLQDQGAHSEARYKGVIDCIRKVYLKEGVAGFYRGCATNLLRTTPAAVITFTSFEMIHRFLLDLFPPEPEPHIQPLKH